MSAHICHMAMDLMCDQCNEILEEVEYMYRCNFCGNAYVVEVSEPIEWS